MATYPVEFHRRLDQKWESRIEQILSVTANDPLTVRNRCTAMLRASGAASTCIGTHDWGEVFCEPQQTER